MTGYKKGVRPVQDWRNSTMVAIDVMVYAILSVVSVFILGIICYEIFTLH
ncbi:5HT3A protein, partial [Amia calva]|nr:5HT3A protein [Amia calva]